MSLSLVRNGKDSDMKVVSETDIHLEPCPLCGHSAELKTDKLIIAGVANYVPHFWVKCTNAACGIAPRSDKSQQDAVDKWNMRP